MRLKGLLAHIPRAWFFILSCSSLPSPRPTLSSWSSPFVSSSPVPSASQPLLPKSWRGGCTRCQPLTSAPKDPGKNSAPCSLVPSPFSPTHTLGVCGAGVQDLALHSLPALRCSHLGEDMLRSECPSHGWDWYLRLPSSCQRPA